MAYDFRAQQVRLTRIISTGSSPILVYPSASAADFEGNLVETFDTSSVGTDVFFYVSGSDTAKSVFGGAVSISGTLSASFFGAAGEDTNVQFNQNGVLVGSSIMMQTSGALVMGFNAGYTGASVSVYGPGALYSFKVTSSTTPELYPAMEVITNGLHMEPLYATLELAAPTDSGSIPAQLLTGSGLIGVNGCAVAKCDLNVVAMDELALGFKSWTCVASFAISGGIWNLMDGEAHITDIASSGSTTNWSIDVKTDGRLDVTGSSGSNMSFLQRLPTARFLPAKPRLFTKSSSF